MVLVLLALIGCSLPAFPTPVPPPLVPVRSFFEAWNAGKSDQALNYVHGTILLPPVPVQNFLDEMDYEIADSTPDSAHVLVSGYIHIANVPLKKYFSFTATVVRVREQWYLENTSLEEFLKSLLTL